MENKYQKALNKIVKSCCPNCIDENGCSSCDIEKICNATAKSWVNILQELVDKEKIYTEEEIKKEWEELGYKWDEKLYTDSIALSKRVEKPWLKNETYTETHFITINIINKTYRAEIFRWLGCEGKPLTFQEHELLTKTFKWLGWYDEK